MRVFAFLSFALTTASSLASDARAQQAAIPAPGGPTTQALAREREMARRVPVTVALVAALPAPDSVPAVILRRRDVSPHDVILLRRDRADGARLAAAVLHLLVLRDRTGDTASVSSTVRLPTARTSPRAWERTEQVRTARVVGRLRQAVPRNVPGVGTVPATEIYLPSRRMREEARKAARQTFQ